MKTIKTILYSLAGAMLIASCCCPKCPPKVTILDGTTVAEKADTIKPTNDTTVYAVQSAQAIVAPTALTGITACALNQNINMKDLRFDFSQLDAAGGYKIWLRDVFNPTLNACSCNVNVTVAGAPPASTPFLYIKASKAGPSGAAANTKFIRFSTTPPTAPAEVPDASFSMAFGDIVSEPTAGCAIFPHCDKQNLDIVNNLYTSVSPTINELKFIGTENWRNGYSNPTFWHTIYLERSVMGIVRKAGGGLEFSYRKSALGAPNNKHAETIDNGVIKPHTNSN